MKVKCPNCDKVLEAYHTDTAKLQSGETIHYTFATRYCPYCRYELFKHHATCENCGYTDWAKQIAFLCPLCGGEMR